MVERKCGNRVNSSTVPDDLINIVGADLGVIEVVLKELPAPGSGTGE